jgi:putative ABC transport system permease protein
MSATLVDIRHSARVLRRAPGFALAVIVILALGIGANSALFTAVDQTVIRPLPYANPDRLVMLWEDFSTFGVPKQRVSPGTFMDWKRHTQAFDEIAAYGGRVFNLSGGGPPEEVFGEGVTANLLPMLGVPSLLGRTFTPDEDAPGNKTVVLSYGLWKRRFAGDASVVGRAVLMSDEKYTVIGVMPKGFQYPDREAQVWVPLGLTADLLPRRNSHFLWVTGRLKPGQNIQQGQADMNVIARNLARAFPASNDRVGITVVPLKEEFLGSRDNELTLLLCSGVCVLLIACANIGNLLLARSASRRREMAIRAAMGASPSRLLRQILVEALTLSIAGGALGLAGGRWCLGGLQGMVPQSLAGLVELKLDGRVLVFTAGLSILSGVLFGLAPAVQLARSGISSSLKQVGRSSSTPSGGRLRDILVVCEMSIALVLVVGAVLLIQSLARLRAVDPGFRVAGILTAEIAAPFPKYEDTGQRQRFYAAIQEKVSAIPGVVSTGLTSDLPYTSRGNTMGLIVEGQTAKRDLGMDALFRLVSAGYLETIGAQLKEGRLLDAHDQQDTTPSVVVNETLARTYWPNSSAIGHRIDTGTGNGALKWMTVVGVVRDVRERGLDLANKSAVYVPFTQTTIGFFLPSEIAVLTTREPLSLSRELQQAVWSVDPEQPVNAIKPMEAIAEGELLDRTQVLRLLGAFAGLALVLAALGIYGVLSYVVSQRTPEIGLRMALGANRWHMIRLVSGYSARLTGIGLLIGLIGALGATRLLSSLLFGVSAVDPATFLAVAAGIAVVAFFASLAPVLHAASVDPIIALRED